MIARKPRPSGALSIGASGSRRFPPLLRRAWFSLNQAFRRRIAHLGITPDQYTVMRTLFEGDPQGMTQRELSSAMSSDPNTIASLLRRMEETGFLVRTPHEQDRRAYRIQLCEAGQAKYETAHVIALALQAEVLSNLPATRHEEFLRSLAAVAAACRAAIGRSPRNGT